MKKSLMNSLFLLVFIVFFSLVFANPVYAACSPEQVILKLSDITNAHGEVYNGLGMYSTEICYDTIFGIAGSGNRVCSGTNKVLGLSSETNAHAQIPILPDYSVPVCYDTLECQASNDCNSLGTDYKCIVTLSALTNAHLAICSSPDAYTTKICCKTPVSPCSLTSAKWTNLLGAEIINTQVGDNIKLVVEGTNCDSKELSFIVWEDDGILGRESVNINPSNDVMSSGEATTTWIAEWQIDTGNPEYYFIASVVGSNPIISIQSGLLEVYPLAACMCNDGTLCGECSVTPGQYCQDDGTGNGNLITNYCACPECSVDSDCPIERPDCVTDATGACGQCQNIGVTACEDYADQVACGNFTPQIAVDTIINNGGSCSDYTGGDGCFYDITCVCKWDDTNGCYGSQEQTKDCPGLPPVTGSCDMLSRILKGCEEPPLGFKTIEITKIISGEGNPNDWEPPCEGTQVLEKKCIDRVLLKFFNTANLIIAILIIIVFYLIVLRKRKRYRGQKGKKRRENKKRKK